MKIFLLILSIHITILSYGQVGDRISYISNKKDTLILPNNEVGHQILFSWDLIPKSERPVIVCCVAKTITVLNYFIKKEEEN